MNKPANESKPNNQNSKWGWFLTDNETLKEMVKGPKIFLTLTFAAIALLATTTTARLGIGYSVGATLLAYAIGYLTKPEPTKDLEELGAYLLLTTVTVSGLVLSLALLVSTLLGL